MPNPCRIKVTNYGSNTEEFHEPDFQSDESGEYNPEGAVRRLPDLVLESEELPQWVRAMSWQMPEMVGRLRVSRSKRGACWIWFVDDVQPLTKRKVKQLRRVAWQAVGQLGEVAP